MATNYFIRNATVVSLDPNIGTVLNHDVLIKNHTIAAVGPDLEVPSDATVVDGRNAIVCPGFVDTHRHMWQTQLRTITGDFTIGDYGAHIRNRYGSCYTPDDVYLGNLCGALESLEAGTTCLLDHSHIMNSPAHADSAVQGLRDSRIRGVFCYGLYNNPVFTDEVVSKGTAMKDPQEGQRWRRRDAARVRQEQFPLNDTSTLLRFGFAPTEVERTPLAETIEEIEFGRSLGAAIITGHVAMGPLDRGLHLVRSLADRNLLGPDILVSHGATLTDDELAAIKKTGASISSTPDTEMQMGMGMPVALKAAQDHHCKASLGSDINSNNPADMFAQMRLMLQAQRYVDAGNKPPPPKSLSRRCFDVLSLATQGGADAMGLGDITGSVTPGKRADLVLIRCDSLRLTPIHDPVAAIVLYASVADVDSVWVDGIAVKRGGAMLFSQGKATENSWPALRERLRDSAEGIVERSKLIKTEENDASIKHYYRHSGMSQ